MEEQKEPHGTSNLYNTPIDIYKTDGMRHFGEQAIEALYDKLVKAGITTLPKGALVQVNNRFIPDKISDKYFSGFVQWEVKRDTPIEELKRFYDQSIVIYTLPVKKVSTYNYAHLQYDRKEHSDMPDWLDPKVNGDNMIKVGTTQGEFYPGEKESEKLPIISLYIPKLFGNLSATERVEVIKERVLLDKSNTRITVQGLESDPEYLHFLPSQTGAPHREEMLKIHLNVNSDKILEVSLALAKLQEDEAKKGNPFGFKVLAHDQGYKKLIVAPGGGWPPRLVIYPMVDGLYVNGELNEAYLNNFIVMLDEELRKIENIDTDYRARFHKLHASYLNGVIEIVSGGTVIRGDTSGGRGVTPVDLVPYI